LSTKELPPSTTFSASRDHRASPAVAAGRFELRGKDASAISVAASEHFALRGHARRPHGGEHVIEAQRV
jgi:hypothetical protein